MNNWQNPHIEILNASEKYDETKPMKRWVDRRATDPNNLEQSFTYNKLVQGKLESFVLTRAEAGSANIPLIGLADTSNTSTWNRLEVPIPIRDLKPGEYIQTDPFNNIQILKNIDRAITLSDLAAIEQELKEIKQILSRT